MSVRPGRDATDRSLHPTFSKIRTRGLQWLAAWPTAGSWNSELHDQSPTLVNHYQNPKRSSRKRAPVEANR